MNAQRLRPGGGLTDLATERPKWFFGDQISARASVGPGKAIVVSCSMGELKGQLAAFLQGPPVRARWGATYQLGPVGSFGISSEQVWPTWQVRENYNIWCVVSNLTLDVLTF